jgi:hypothetical protein
MFTQPLQAPAPTLPSVQVLRAGTVNDMNGTEINITPELMNELADSYSPAIHAAPVVIGHPRDNAPAFGHIAAVAINGDGLDAALDNLDPAFIEAHQAKRYPQRSLSFWPAGHPDNPLPDKSRPYIRHLGFLGAMPPAIKGLRGADLGSPRQGIVHITMDNPQTDAQAARAARDYRARMTELGITVSLSEALDAVDPPTDGHLQRSDAEVARAARDYRARMANLGIPVSLAEAVDFAEAG